LRFGKNKIRKGIDGEERGEREGRRREAVDKHLGKYVYTVWL